MDNASHGGKGDKYREVDVIKYRNNFDNIDFSSLKKNKLVMKHDEISEKVREVDSNFKALFLDDIRVPENADVFDEGKPLLTLSRIPKDEWNIVRTYDEFCEYIDKHGIPNVVSFDNDLSVGCMMVYCEMISQGKEFDQDSVNEKQGIHCAEYLVSKCQELNVDIPEYYIHSANHCARPIIRQIMESAKVKH